jgi:hypothetical protein
MEKRRAWFTFDDSAYSEQGECLWYFGLPTRTPGPLTQRQVVAILDIAPDGTLAGVELISQMPPLNVDTDDFPRTYAPASSPPTSG